MLVKVKLDKVWGLVQEVARLDGAGWVDYVKDILEGHRVYYLDLEGALPDKDESYMLYINHHFREGIFAKAYCHKGKEATKEGVSRVAGVRIEHLPIANEKDLWLRWVTITFPFVEIVHIPSRDEVERVQKLIEEEMIELEASSEGQPEATEQG